MSRMQRLMAVLLVTVSLFPCVSASDDVISFAYVSAGLETRSGFGHSIPNENSDNASGIYLTLQNLEHLQISAFYTLLVAICFFGILVGDRMKRLPAVTLICQQSPTPTRLLN